MAAGGRLDCSPTVTLQVTADEVVLANGFVQVAVDLRAGSISRLQADSAGLGEYGSSVLAGRGLVLERMEPDGRVVSGSHPVASAQNLVSGGCGWRDPAEPLPSPLWLQAQIDP